MFPQRLERDTQIIDWAALTLALSTSTSAAAGDDIRMTSDGLVHSNFGVAHTKGLTVAVAGNKITAAGINLQGPDPGDEYTLYSYNAFAWCVDPELMPILFCAVSIAIPTNAVGGDLCEHYQLIALPQSLGTTHRALQSEGTIILPKTDAVAASRAVAFGIGFATAGSTSGTLGAYTRLSVRRLMENEPAIIDTTKLG